MTGREYRQDDLRDTGYCPLCGATLSAMTVGARGYCERHGWQFADWGLSPAPSENLTPGVMTGKENDR